MIDLITDNVSTIIVGGIFIFLAILAIWKVIRDKRKGKCCGDCNNCSGCPQKKD